MRYRIDIYYRKKAVLSIIAHLKGHDYVDVDVRVLCLRRSLAMTSRRVGRFRGVSNWPTCPAGKITFTDERVTDGMKKNDD